jgi:dipeptide/tripeptide permease
MSKEVENQPQVLGHPAGLYTLFFAEMWERFSYYGMRALLIFYMTKGLLAMTDSQASTVYGAYTALVYMTPFIGGMLADRILGKRLAVVLGGILMAAGHLLMTYESEWPFYFALAMLIAGNGFFKPNISTMVGTLYGDKDPRRDNAFNLFYMGINLGAAISPLLCGYVGEVYGWHWGFGLATIGMMVGLAVFIMPNTISAALILAAAAATTVALFVLRPDNYAAIGLNIFVAICLVVSAGISCVALRRGGLPNWAGQRPSNVDSKHDWKVYLGTLISIPIFALLVSGFAPFMPPKETKTAQKAQSNKLSEEESGAVNQAAAEEPEANPRVERDQLLDKYGFAPEVSAAIRELPIVVPSSPRDGISLLPASVYMGTRMIDLAELKANGRVLAKDVQSPDGSQVLANKDTVLDSQMIRMLTDAGITEADVYKKSSNAKIAKTSQKVSLVEFNAVGRHLVAPVKSTDGKNVLAESGTEITSDLIKTLQSAGISEANVVKTSDDHEGLAKVGAAFLKNIGKPAGLVLMTLGVFAFGYLLIEIFRLPWLYRDRMLAALVLIFFNLVFFSFFEQAGNSMNVFTDRNVSRVEHSDVVTPDLVGKSIRIQPTQLQLGYVYSPRTASEADGSVPQKTEKFTIKELDKLREVVKRLPEYTNFEIEWQVDETHVGMKYASRRSELPASIFQALNAVFILVFALVFNVLWTWLQKHGCNPSSAVKFALGLIQLGLGFYALVIGASLANDQGMVSVWWLVLAYYLHTTGELCLSPVGLSAMTKLSAKHLVSTLMGAWFLATAFSQYVAGIISELAGVDDSAVEDGFPPPTETLELSTVVFQQVSYVAIGCGVICLLLAPLITYWMHENVTTSEENLPKESS